MSHSFSNNFVVLDDKYFRNQNTYQPFQPTVQTTRVSSNPPNINNTIHYRTQKVDYHQPITSTSLSSYKTFSPYKAQPAPDTLQTVRRLLEVAIQNKWTKQTLDTNWGQFKDAFSHYDSKVELDNFFKSVTLKPNKKRSKSEPRKKQQLKEEPQNMERVDRHRPVSLHRQLSYNYEPYPRQPVVRTIVKSKSDHFKVPKVKIEQKDHQKLKNARQLKMFKLCEEIEEGLAKGYKVITTRGMPF